MFNLLNGEFYKWRKSKSFVVCCLVTVAFIIFMYGSLLLADKIQKGEIEQGTASIVVEDADGSEDILENLSVLDMEEMMIPSIATIIIAVFISIFVIGEFGNGTIKNMVGKGTNRSSIFLAKYIMAIIAGLVLVCLTAVLTLVGGPVVFGTDCINAQVLKNVLQYTGLQVLLGVAFAGLVVTISEMSRNLGAGISISLGVLMLGNAVFTGVDLLFHGVDFRPSEYWIVNLMSQCPTTDISQDFVVRVVVAAAFWIVVSAALGMLHFKKADVK